jgi:hypothetical protein
MPISEKRTVVYRGLKLFVWTVQITLFLFAGILVFKNVLGPSAKDVSSLDYRDFVSILLAALGVMIAVFTVIISILAIWGYNNIQITAKETAEKTAKETAEKIAKEWMVSNAPELIQKQVDLLTDTTLGPGNDGTAADDIGNQAG